MNWSRAEQIADAVLYEGYLLYPYRPSAIKNRQRWNFGVVYPRVHFEQAPCDSWTMHTECLVEADSGCRVQVRVRCLQLSLRSIGELEPSDRDLSGTELSAFRPVDRLAIGDRVFQPWQEAVLREVTPSAFEVGSATAQSDRHDFHFPEGRTLEALKNDRGQTVGVILREQRAVRGVVETVVTPLERGIYKVEVTIQNITDFGADDHTGRDPVLMHSMLSTHTILCVENGRFVSLLEPAEDLSACVSQCQNSNTWPVLVGDAGDRDVMLSSPIILYDYPQIAPESPGDLFDGTEIDEILALRIMTMTDAEKKEIREADPRGRELLERTETLPPEHLMKLHGVLRNLRPSGEKAS